MSVICRGKKGAKEESRSRENVLGETAGISKVGKTHSCIYSNYQTLTNIRVKLG